MAHGPAFKKHFKVDTFRNVDIYGLMCHVLGVEPAPNNGSMDIVSQMLLADDDAGHNKKHQKSSLSRFLRFYICIALSAAISC